MDERSEGLEKYCGHKHFLEEAERSGMNGSPSWDGWFGVWMYFLPSPPVHSWLPGVISEDVQLASAAECALVFQAPLDRWDFTGWMG